MTYKEALEYIHSVTWKGSRPGLERITELCHKINDPQDTLKYIHVAGTNGKGSVCAMTESILRKAGYKTGLFTSPYIEFFNERIQINGKPVSDKMLAEVTEYIKPFADSMSDAPTEFELISAIGFEIFKREKCDIVVLEVGMGGRLDSTNVIKTNILSVITSIALDHTAFLGDTKEKIAAEKAGIIKEYRPVVYGGDDLSAENVIKEKAQEKNAPFYKSEDEKIVSSSPDGIHLDCGGYNDLFVSLSGLYQSRNVATAVKIAQILRQNGYNITDDNIRIGLASTLWKGRFEKLHSSPDIYYDGGHNIEGVTYAAKTINEYFTKKGEKVNLVFGVMADKAWCDMVKIISPYVNKAFCVIPDNARALNADELVSEFAKNGVCAQAFESFDKAIELSGKDGTTTVALGSLYMYSQVKNAVMHFAKNK